ncbi:MAG TPA: c-type cytochrome [Polyangiaceae bacterium]|jgi:mono/diheme cytochrome c family protein
MRTVKRALCALSAICLFACGGTKEEAKSPASTEGAPAVGAAADQASQGEQLYGANCASCHGADGKGNANTPAVVGTSALPLDAQAPSKLRKTQFHTAADVLSFIEANMPPNKAGSLSKEEYEAILAFDLKANGVDLTGKQVNADTASSFVLHQ